MRPRIVSSARRIRWADRQIARWGTGLVSISGTKPPKISCLDDYMEAGTGRKYRRTVSMEFHYATVWEAIADAVPEQAALIQGSRTISWREYETRSARLAAALTAAGLGPGSKVALYLFNGPEYAEAQFAAFKMRAVPVNVNY